MEERLLSTIQSFFSQYKPDYHIPELLDNNIDLTLIFDLTSFEWLVLLMQIEDEFQIRFKEKEIKNFSINSIIKIMNVRGKE